MHRWLSILLLVLLPLQFAWAKAADHDVHGSGSHEMHFGHHDHGDRDPAPAGDSGTGGQPADADGHHCHGQCSAMPATVCLLAAVVGESSPGVLDDLHGGAHAPARPERPQWRRLA